MKLGRHMTRVLIGIQARSTSTRLPNKGEAIIGDKTMIEHVLHNVEESINFLKRNLVDTIEFSVALLVPTGDGLKRHADKVVVIEGDEHDVLSRYQKAFVHYRPDYVVRLTGDCPFIPDYVLSKHIRSAIFGSLDYCNNRWFGTAPDGHDTEVMSKRMFRWVCENASTPSEKEHVTLKIRTDMPGWAKVGHVIGHVDQSDIKLSVDTAEDLERVRQHHEKIETLLKNARTHHKSTVIFRL